MVEGGLAAAMVRAVATGLGFLALIAPSPPATANAATAQQQAEAKVAQLAIGSAQEQPPVSAFRMPERTPAELAEWLAVAAGRLSLPPITRLELDGSSGDRFAVLYQRLRAYAEQGWTATLLTGRYELIGAAYFDRGPNSLSILDAHLLAAHGLLAEDDWATASRHLAAGRTIVAADDFASQVPPTVPVPLADAWIAHRLTLMECADVLAAAGDDALGTAEFGRLNESLAAMLQQLVVDGDTGAQLADDIVATLAVLHVAAGQQPQDDRIRAAVVAAFGD